jgi:hypothetical protein
MALPDFTRVEMVFTYSGEHHHLWRWGQEGVLARRLRYVRFATLLLREGEPWLRSLRFVITTSTE